MFSINNFNELEIQQTYFLRLELDLSHVIAISRFVMSSGIASGIRLLE